MSFQRMMTETDITSYAALRERVMAVEKQVTAVEKHIERVDNRAHSLLILMFGTFLSAVITVIVVLFEFVISA